jgi:formamidopyrimidine-DNA glycosylase
MAMHIDKLLTAFKFADLQTFCNIVEILDSHGKDVKDVIKYVQKIHKEKRSYHEQLERNFEVWELKALKCRDCGTTMRLRTLQDNDCHWICPKCLYGEYRPHSVAEELDIHGIDLEGG